MEFLRFGSSIPGSYWGCCAVDIIQNFKVDPDQKASIQCVSGDSGTALSKDGKGFFGKTYREIFWSRLKIGTFSDREMPNHAFFAVLTESQINSGYGAKWLKILHEAGFEFIRTVDNSVYTGSTLLSDPNKPEGYSHPNHIFGLFRNVGMGAIKDPFKKPAAWEALGENTKTQREIYDSIEVKWFNETELTKEGVPVVLAGLRSTNPQEPKTTRDERNKKSGKKAETKLFATSVPAHSTPEETVALSA